MMSDVIRQETVVFLMSVVHGILLTLAYDFLRALRRAFPHGIVAVSAEDFLYWIAAAFLTFCLVFGETEGVLRGYVAVGIGLGAVLGHFTVGRLEVRWLSRFFLALGNGVRRMFRALSRLFGVLRRLLRTLKRLVCRVLGVPGRVLGRLFRRLCLLFRRLSAPLLSGLSQRRRRSATRAPGFRKRRKSSDPLASGSDTCTEDQEKNPENFVKRIEIG